MAADLKEKKHKRRKIVGFFLFILFFIFSIHLRNVRTVLYKDPFNNDCRDAVLLTRVLKVNCRPK